MMMSWHNPYSVSFSRARADFEAGRQTPRQFLERCIDVIATRDGVVKAFVTTDLRSARVSADAATRRYKSGKPLSPIDGCPVAIKDIIATADMPTQMNSPIYDGWRPRYDAACVLALRNAGAVVIGKTVTTEFAIGRSGPTRNPFDVRRTPGGSSSGSAAAVGAGMVPAALGTQTQGSILRPASYCGVVGYKPTIDTLHTGGIHLLSPTSDHLGVIAATVEDAWFVAAEISIQIASPGRGFLASATGTPPTPRKPRKLIQLLTRGWDEIDAGTRDAFNDAIEDLRQQGVRIDTPDNRADVADLERQLERGIDGALGIIAYEMRWPYASYAAQHGRRAIGARIRELIELAEHITPADYTALLNARRRVQQATARCLEGYDGVLTLASSGPATVGLAHTGSRTFPSYGSWLGLPAFSLPLLTVHGLPVGVQLMGRAGTDPSLFAAARWMMNTFARDEGSSPPARRRVNASR